MAMRLSLRLILILSCCLADARLQAVEQPAVERPEAKANAAPNVPRGMLPRVHEAQKQSEAGHFAEAERIFGELLKEAPENIYLLSNYGGALVATGKHDLAVETLRKIVTLTPKDPKAAVGEQGYADAHFNLAVIYLTQNPPDLENARHYYIRAIELGAQRDASLEVLMKVSVKAGATPAVIPGLPGFPAAAAPAPASPAMAAVGSASAKTAVGAVAQASSQPGQEAGWKPAPQSRAAIEPASTKPATATIGPAAPAEPSAPKSTPPTAAAQQGVPGLPPELQAMAREGKEQFAHGNYIEAEKIYRQILRKEPNNVYVLTNLGVVLLRARKYKLAEEFFRKALTIAPENGLTHCSMGVVYYQEGNYDDAVNELTKALGINSNDATAHNYLGLTSSQKGWQEAAEKELKTATELDPSYGDAHFNLALLLASKVPADRNNAREHYERAIKLGVARDAALEELILGPAALAGSTKLPGR
jgi:tetratricopeptide (TPR) repeat protein